MRNICLFDPSSTTDRRSLFKWSICKTLSSEGLIHEAVDHVVSMLKTLSQFIRVYMYVTRVCALWYNTSVTRRKNTNKVYYVQYLSCCVFTFVLHTISMSLWEHWILIAWQDNSYRIFCMRASLKISQVLQTCAHFHHSQNTRWISFIHLANLMWCISHSTEAPLTLASTHCSAGWKPRSCHQHASRMLSCTVQYVPLLTGLAQRATHKLLSPVSWGIFCEWTSSLGRCKRKSRKTEMTDATNEQIWGKTCVPVSRFPEILK